jgi:hypothetical protein
MKDAILHVLAWLSGWEWCYTHSCAKNECLKLHQEAYRRRSNQ